MAQQPRPRVSDDSPVRVYEQEVHAFVNLAEHVGSAPPQPSIDATSEEKAAWDEHAKAVASFSDAFVTRLTSAYHQGEREATSKEAQAATNARSYVLYIVVGVLVLMPIIAMVLQLDPQKFGAYLAPITGIAGTIVGYWFGTADRRSPR